MLCHACQVRPRDLLSAHCRECNELIEAAVAERDNLTVGEEDLEGMQILTPAQLAHKEAQAANHIESAEKD